MFCIFSVLVETRPVLCYFRAPHYLTPITWQSVEVNSLPDWCLWNYLLEKQTVEEKKKLKQNDVIKYCEDLDFH